MGCVKCYIDWEGRIQQNKTKLEGVGASFGGEKLEAVAGFRE